MLVVDLRTWDIRPHFGLGSVIEFGAMISNYPKKQEVEGKDSFMGKAGFVFLYCIFLKCTLLIFV